MLLLSLVRAMSLLLVVGVTRALLGYYGIVGIPASAIVFLATITAFFLDQALPHWLIEKFNDDKA